MRTKIAVKVQILFLVLILLFGTSAVVMAEDEAGTAAGATGTITLQKPSLSTKKMYFYVGGKSKLKLENADGKVKWKSSNKKIATVSSTGKVKAKTIGKATVTAICNNKQYKCKIVVLSNETFVKKWCKSIAKELKREYKNPYDRVLAAADYISTTFHYGRAKNNFEVLKKRVGTCYSGNKLLVEILKAMGYKAKLRFAAKDNMSRYPAGVFFMSEHYNVLVKIKGKKHFVDGTPGAGFIYMSTTKKPIYMCEDLFGQYVVTIDRVPGHN